VQNPDRIPQTPQAEAGPDVNRVIRQIAEPIRHITVSRPRPETLIVHLNPPELGRVEVAVHSQDRGGNALEVTIHVERPETERLLAQNLHQLRGALESQGLDLQGLHLAFGRARGDGRQAEADSEGRDGDVPRGEMPDQQETSPTPVTALTRGGVHVNLVI
jgi:flagellar hook-length control protein FliK